MKMGRGPATGLAGRKNLGSGEERALPVWEPSIGKFGNHATVRELAGVDVVGRLWGLRDYLKNLLR